MSSDFKKDNILAVKPLNDTDVEIRYGDGTEPVIIKNTTTSSVMRQVTKHKAAKSGTDSA